MKVLIACDIQEPIGGCLCGCHVRVLRRMRREMDEGA